MRRFLLLPMIFLLLAGPALADPFRLGADDRVDVRVFSRPDLSLSLKVDGDGNLRIPLIGSVHAAGLTIDEVEARLTNACRDRAGILDPHLTVTVVETGPIFVGGTVQSPGRYPWASDLTPAKAYILAGGAPRLLENGGPMLTFEAYRAVEQEEQTLTRLAGAILRRARLSAEADMLSTFDPPKGWSEGLKPAQASELLVQERQLFVKRREALAGEISNLKRQSQILLDQEVAYKASLEKKGQQRSLLQQELSTITGNAENARLAPVTRLLSLKRLIVEVENDQRDIERRIGEAKLQRAIAEQTTTNLQNARAIEASSQLADVERELVSLRDSLDPVHRRADVGRLAIGQGGFAAKTNARRALAFTIRREVNGKVEVIEADADTKLEPRDLVQIASEPPAHDTVAETDRLETGQGKSVTTAAIPASPPPVTKSIQRKSVR